MFQNLTAPTVVNTDWGHATSVTITGVVLVFCMLVLLVLILAVSGKIFSLLSKDGSKKPKAEKPVAPKKQEAAKPVVALNNTQDNNEIIAVISAAVAMMYEGSEVKPIIRKIQKSTTRKRPSWTKAGIFENTRSF